MKIFAKRDGSVYMLVKDGVDEIEAETEGRVLDARTNRLYPWMNANSIIARGYWTLYSGSQSIVEPMVEAAEEIERVEYGPAKLTAGQLGLEG